MISAQKARRLHAAAVVLMGLSVEGAETGSAREVLLRWGVAAGYEVGVVEDAYDDFVLGGGRLDFSECLDWMDIRF